MFKKTQFCLWIAVLPCSAPFAEENHSLAPHTTITQHADSLELPVKVTARDHLLLEKMADKLPNVSSTSGPVFSQAMQLIDNSRKIDQTIWVQQFSQISDARMGRIVDLYLQLYDAEEVEFAESLDDLLHLRAGLTAEQGYQKARIASLEREVLFKLFQKGLTLSTEEELTPLAALSLVWWLHQESQPTLAELSASIYRVEHKEIRMQAAILYNHSHYGNRYGDITGISANELADWGMGQLDEPGQPIFSASKALRVIHEGMNALPAIVQSDEAYLANGFTPQNAQGSYLTSLLPEIILTGCGLIGFDACSQQDLTQFLALQHPVGSLAFSLQTTLNIYYRLQGKALDELDGKNTEQLYDLLIEEEKHLRKTGGAGYNPTIIFLSHFSQSNEIKMLTLGQIARAFKRIAEPMNESDLPEAVQTTFSLVKLLAGNIIDGTAIDLEQERFLSELKWLAQFPELSQPLHALAHSRQYKTEQEKLERQLDYLDMRLAYRHPPAAFDEEQAIRDILQENGVKNIDFPRKYTYRRDLQHGYPQKEFGSPFDEFKRRRNASNHFVAKMSMVGNNGRLINVFDTLDAKKAEYYAQVRSHPAIWAQAIEVLINSGERPEGIMLLFKIDELAQAYQPESENARFWGNAWTSLENHWVCKLPLPNPMCTIARVEGPRYRNEKENMAAGMTAMVMEAGQLRGMERGVKMIENSPQAVDSTLSPSLSVEGGEVIPNETPTVAQHEVEINPLEEALEPMRQTIQNLHGKLTEVQQVRLKDPSVPGGTREAWVRQGGSGAYWEVDLATGQDLGLVLKEGPEFIKTGRLLGGGGGQSKGASLEFNPEIKLGRKIGSGMVGEVYLDANNPGFVIKKLTTHDRVLLTDVHVKEVEFFNRYYGEGAAELINYKNQNYIRMYRVQGKTLAEINSKIYPPNAKERFLNMLADLGYYNIVHDDLNFNNIIYDEKTNTFYPIDFDKAYDGYYSPTDEFSGYQGWGINIRVRFILEHIEEYTKT
ncbi:putative type III secreted effector protein [Yersinia thracica]|uniref:Putative type III secreted effector protein n=1 Tax=Yersinia thracica TaxID=2890319 RepID=A0A0T9QKH8_9GAMM|nr:putative type III secreted effector protein [Yersinia thracica]